MAKDLYGSFGSVPAAESTNQGTVLPGQDLHATPNMFGAQIGEATKYQGKVLQEIGERETKMATHYGQMATEAKVNDDFATKYAPAAAELRNQYDQLQGQDKIHGYDGYINSLRELNNQFMGNANSPYEQQLWSKTLNDRLASETAQAKNELVASQIEFSNAATANKAMALGDYAVQNYNNPEIVESALNSIDATITLHNIDQGVNPETPEGQAIIEEQHRSVRGGVAVDMITSAVRRGDAAEANKIRGQFGPFIPGYQQIALDNVLHAENMRQTGMKGGTALRNGQSLPQAVGMPPVQVQATVANTAEKYGVNPNHALTVAMIESNMGQNLGERGDIGQTGKGGDLPAQAENMVAEIKKSEGIAQKALGRAPEPWETYTCYQQGASGGPALLKASTENPGAKAVDVLAPLYKNPKDAFDAIVKNGGNATMTSGDYLGFLKKKYNDNMGRVLCVVPEPTVAEEFGPERATLLTQAPPPSVGGAILAAHNSTGETVQPAASPRGSLLNFDEKYPAMMQRANAIPNLAVRKAVIQNINEERSKLASSASAYSTTLINQAKTLAVDNNFTSMTQVPPDLMSELLQEHPETLNYLERSAERNLTQKGGTAGHDAKEYGPGMFDLMRQVNENKITSITDLMKHLPGPDGTGGDITISGFDKLKTLLIHDPQSASDTAMQTQAFKVIKRQLSGEDELLGWPDPKGEELFSRAMPKLYQALEEGKAKGLTMGELTNPDNPNWIGNAVQSLKRSPEQQNIDMMSALPADIAQQKIQGTRTLGAIMAQYYGTQDVAKRAALRKEAEDLGFVRKEGASAPVVQ